MEALLIVDPQNDFCEGGSLGANQSQEIFPVINSLRERRHFPYTFVSQDWHPENHVSFQVNNPESTLFEEKYIEKTGKTQVMWPVHCVQNTAGAEINKDLQLKGNEIFIKKGTDPDHDSYSAFGCEEERTSLAEQLREKGIEKLYVCGLALDYCVGNSCIDSAKNGITTYLIMDATKGIKQESVDAMNSKLVNWRVQFINSSDL